MADPRPIGVFDSGVGGLTVARAIIDLLPGEPLLYVGDTARFPYGPKPLEEIKRYALEIATYLVDRGVKLLVVGVIDPGVRAAVRATHNRRIGMIGTEATVKSGAYDRAVARTRKDVELFPQACPVFVEFVERGDTSSPQLFAAAREYLAPLQAA